MKIIPPIAMGGYNLDEIVTSEYFNGCLAVQVYCSNGELACTVSVNIPNQSQLLQEDEFFLKDYSENEKSVAKLLERGIIEIVDKPAVRTGYVEAKIARLTVKI